jgi:imidazole glycerol-phosphate synthase subunit HisH
VKLAIVDYGMANLRSVQKAFAEVGVDAQIVDTPQEIARAERVVLPGVGAFADAVATIRHKQFDQPLLEHIGRDRPFLGICLGLQMLFDVGHEDGRHAGLGIVGGSCVRFEVDRTHGLKVPHMGWNQLHLEQDSPLFAGLPPGANVYFVHSYHVVPDDPGIIASTTDYGGPFISSIRRGNLMAVQFHPEKSQAVGLGILRNFGAM